MWRCKKEVNVGLSKALPLKREKKITSIFSTARWQHAASAAWPSWKYHSASSLLTLCSSLQEQNVNYARLLKGWSSSALNLCTGHHIYFWTLKFLFDLQKTIPLTLKMQSVWASSTTYIAAHSSGSVSQNLLQYGNVSSYWQKRNPIFGYTCELCISISPFAQKLYM